MAAFHEVLEMIKTCAGRREERYHRNARGLLQPAPDLDTPHSGRLESDFRFHGACRHPESRLDFWRSFSGKEQNLHMIQNRIAEIIIRNALIFAAADQDDLLRKDGEGSHRTVRTGVDGTVIILTPSSVRMSCRRCSTPPKVRATCCIALTGT